MQRNPGPEGPGRSTRRVCPAAARAAGLALLVALFGLLGTSVRSAAVAEAEPAPDELEEIEPAAPHGSVSRSAFTTAVVDREPTDSLDALPSGLGRVHYFTELRDLEGETVIHRWSFDGVAATEISFAVGGPRWRVYSTKRVDPGRPGTWSVTVLDGAGNVLAEDRLVVGGSGAPGAGDAGSDDR